MPVLDTILILIVGGFVVSGFVFGFIHTLGNLVGTIIALVATSRLFHPVRDRFAFYLGSGWGSQLFLFVLMFLFLSRLIGLVFMLIERALRVLKWIPFIKTIDRLLGGALGFFEGVIAVGIILYVALLILPENVVREWVQGSGVATRLLVVMDILQALLPEYLRV